MVPMHRGDKVIEDAPRSKGEVDVESSRYQQYSKL